MFCPSHFEKGCEKPCPALRPFQTALNSLQPAADLIVRLFIADIFLSAAFLRLSNWSYTLDFFKQGYHLPFLSAEVAAYLNTGVGLIFAVLLVLGLLGRFPPLVLLFVVVMQILFYPFMHTPLGLRELYNHISLGCL